MKTNNKYNRQSTGQRVNKLASIGFVAMIVACIILSACSTTSNLPEDEVLYTGIKKISYEDKKNTYAESVALTEIEAALAYAPNNSFMGSSSVRFPLPVGLWVYNGLVNKQKDGFSKWAFDAFSSVPITLTAVAPATRVQVATNTLQNYGYFQGKVSYDIIDEKNPKKKKIAYNVKLGEPYLLDSIHWSFPELQDSIIRATKSDSYIATDKQFSVIDLQMEKDRITSEFHNNGLYFYRPDYINYYADSMMVPQRVKLLVMEDPDTPEKAKHKWYFGNTSVYIRNSSSNGARRGAYTDSIMMRGGKFVYQGEKEPVSPRTLFRNFRFRRGMMFKQSSVDETLTNLSGMQMFSKLQFSYIPRDTTQTCDTLDVKIEATMDKLVDAELAFNITQKSNSQIGPNAAVTVSKRNAFGHGETLSLTLKGAYEWQTKAENRNKDQDQINSYDAGLGATLTYPWLVFPGLSQKRFKYATSSSFRFDIDHLNRSGYYRILSFNAEADYNFRTSKYWTHRFTPLSLTYNRLEHTSEKFDSIASVNRALLVSLEDHFIPAMGYTITYDNSFKPTLRTTTWAEFSIKESANLISGVMALSGKDFNKKDKKLFSQPYSQFLKLTMDVRNKFLLTDKSLIATRFYAGVLWSYGNSEVAPYNELFYVGGANDIRAFAAHSIGPGQYYDYSGRGTYLDQAGDLKLELNAEYRFNIVSNLYGALFVDSGNVWLLDKRDSNPGGEVGYDSFLKDIALGTGFGFRYDLEFLILRLDLGIGIHAPYDTGKKGYYNIPKFKDGLGLHFAVGYPF